MPLYVDDIVLIDKCADRLQTIHQKWKRALEGFRISRTKTEYLHYSYYHPFTPSNTIVSVYGQTLPKVHQFQYLGSMLAANTSVDIVVPVVDKLCEVRMRWFGYVMRRDEEFVKALAVPKKNRGRGHTTGHVVDNRCQGHETGTS
ncbi:hypothetical protein EVAR_38671_1 [Eumeta japonica]|uniref:Reverse transcriptase domain-containing protein n=1 Tax=Eumeta variegata TaxID=151549 RepID=A0A4C1YAS5_EUMVA|nr:hypothetical protein EVAR_38671_1 [Eumeta japonica]